MQTLSQYLTKNKIRQAAFAQQINSTQATVSRLAAGTQQPSPEMAATISRATGGEVAISSWPAFAAFAGLQAVERKAGAA